MWEIGSKHTQSGIKQTFFPVLRYNWQTSLYNSKVYSIMVDLYIYSAVMVKLSLVSIHCFVIDKIKSKSKIIFLLCDALWLLRIYSVKNFHIYQTTVLAVVIIVHFISNDYLILGSLYLLATFKSSCACAHTHASTSTITNSRLVWFHSYTTHLPFLF